MPPHAKISHRAHNAEHSILTFQETTHLSLTKYATISSHHLPWISKEYQTDRIPTIVVEHAPWDDTLVDEQHEQAKSALSGTTIHAGDISMSVMDAFSCSPWSEDDTLYDIESPQGTGAKQSRVLPEDTTSVPIKHISSAAFISTPKSTRHFAGRRNEPAEGRLHPLYQRRSQEQLYHDKILRDGRAEVCQAKDTRCSGFGLGIELPVRPEGPSYLYRDGARVCPSSPTTAHASSTTFNLRQRQPRLLRRRARIDLRSAYRSATSGRQSAIRAASATVAGPGAGAGFLEYQITMALLSEMDQGRGGATLRAARRRTLAKPGAAAKGIVRTLGGVVRSLGSQTTTGAGAL